MNTYLPVHMNTYGHCAVLSVLFPQSLPRDLRCRIWQITFNINIYLYIWTHMAVVLYYLFCFHKVCHVTFAVDPPDVEPRPGSEDAPPRYQDVVKHLLVDAAGLNTDNYQELSLMPTKCTLACHDWMVSKLPTPQKFWFITFVTRVFIGYDVENLRH